MPQFTDRRFPATRMRRNRSSGFVRDLVREHNVTVKDLIWPLFIIEGQDASQPIHSLPGVERLTIDRAVEAAKMAHDLGIPALALFPVNDISLRDERGSQALNPDNLVNRAAQAVKAAVPEIGLIADVALDPYTSHGHDGVLDEQGRIANDETVEILKQQAIWQAVSGFDIVAPSDMMDGRVGAIRMALEEAGHHDTRIMAYAAKYASAFYGPFRDAVATNGLLKGDKKTYQQDPANINEALHEVSLDIREGADMVMVKPGLPYLDVVKAVKDAFAVPTFAYHVSGEYAMLKAAAANGWLDYDKCILEVMTAFKRAGADGVLTYAAPDVARLVK